MTPVSALLGGVLAKVASSSGRGAALGGVWRAAVGDTVALHSAPRRFEGGVLVIGCDGAPWREALEAQRTSLLARVQAAVGGRAVRALVFQWP
jgi:predicted nucleic acid-binding Zn ribbon protein